MCLFVLNLPFYIVNFVLDEVDLHWKIFLCCEIKPNLLHKHFFVAGILFVLCFP